MVESQTHFMTAVREHFRVHEGHPQYQTWFDYVMGTNQRGEGVVETVRSFMPGLVGKRHLDIGCAYGGTCVAFAKAGCISQGIDINQGLLDLGRENLADHPDLSIELHLLDCMDWEGISNLEKFDIITCDNVIEHVDVPEKLISQFNLLLNPGGIVYLTIPNAFSIGQIRKDGHYGQLGVSLLDPIDGARLVRYAIQEPSYDVSDYFPLGYYEDQFTKYRLAAQLINPYPDIGDNRLAIIEQAASEVSTALTEMVVKENLPEDIQQTIRRRIACYLQRIEADLTFYHHCENDAARQSFAARIVQEYDVELWYFILRRFPVESHRESGQSDGQSIARRMARRVKSALRSL